MVMDMIAIKAKLHGIKTSTQANNNAHTFKVSLRIADTQVAIIWFNSTVLCILPTQVLVAARSARKR